MERDSASFETAPSLKEFIKIVRGLKGSSLGMETVTMACGKTISSEGKVASSIGSWIMWRSLKEFSKMGCRRKGSITSRMDVFTMGDFKKEKDPD